MYSLNSSTTLCGTCLSSDRTLYLLRDIDGIISVWNDIGLDMHYGRVCWECKAIMKKVASFRRRALLAQQILHSDLEITKIQSISTLRQVNKDTYDEVVSKKMHIDDDDDDKDDAVFEYVEGTDEGTFHCKNEVISDDSHGYDNDFEIDDRDKHKREGDPITDDHDAGVKLDANKEGKEHNDAREEVRRKKSRRKERGEMKVKKKKREKSAPEVDRESANGSCAQQDLFYKVKENYVVYNLSDEELQCQREKDRNSSVYRRASLKCDSCIVTFRREAMYDLHVRECHSEEVGTFVCVMCHTRFPHRELLEEHLKSHSLLYKCGLCKFQHSAKVRILQHLKENHSKEYCCTICDTTFNSRGAARYHIKTHKLEECKLCGKTFSDLKLHMVSHNKVRTEECHICHKSLKSKSSLRFHLMTHSRPNKDEAYCAECDTQFKNKHIYRMHLKTNTKHNVADKECDYCHRRFISKFSLAKHISVVHYNKLDHVCHLCGKKFSIAGHLRNHILVHHEGGSKPRKHICDLCGKGFAIKKCLNDHINTHTGARPYKCDKCPSQFGFKSALYMHNRLKHLKGKKGKKTVPVVSDDPPPYCYRKDEDMAQFSGAT